MINVDHLLLLHHTMTDAASKKRKIYLDPITKKNGPVTVSRPDVGPSKKIVGWSSWETLTWCSAADVATERKGEELGSSSLDESDIQYLAGVAELQPWGYELYLSIDFASFATTDFFPETFFFY